MGTILEGWDLNVDRIRQHLLSEAGLKPVQGASDTRATFIDHRYDRVEDEQLVAMQRLNQSLWIDHKNLSAVVNRASGVVRATGGQEQDRGFATVRFGQQTGRREWPVRVLALVEACAVSESNGSSPIGIINEVARQLIKVAVARQREESASTGTFGEDIQGHRASNDAGSLLVTAASQVSDILSVSPAIEFDLASKISRSEARVCLAKYSVVALALKNLAAVGERYGSGFGEKQDAVKQAMAALERGHPLTPALLSDTVMTLTTASGDTNSDFHWITQTAQAYQQILTAILDGARRAGGLLPPKSSHSWDLNYDVDDGTDQGNPLTVSMRTDVHHGKAVFTPPNDTTPSCICEFIDVEEGTGLAADLAQYLLKRAVPESKWGQQVIRKRM